MRHVFTGNARWSRWSSGAAPQAASAAIAGPQTQRERPRATLASSAAATSRAGMPRAPQRSPASARAIAIDRAIDHHRGMPRGFLPRGLSDTCPQTGAARCFATRAGRCPTTLNTSSRSSLADFRSTMTALKVQRPLCAMAQSRRRSASAQRECKDRCRQILGEQSREHHCLSATTNVERPQSNQRSSYRPQMSSLTARHRNRC